MDTNEPHTVLEQTRRNTVNEIQVTESVPSFCEMTPPPQAQANAMCSSCSEMKEKIKALEKELEDIKQHQRNK